MKRRRPRRRRRYFRPKPEGSIRSITINVVKRGTLGSFVVTPKLVEPAPPLSLPVTATMTMTMPLRLVDPGDLEGLAWEAIVTPSIAAPAAFAVLVDALLERGLIHPPPERPDRDELLALLTAAFAVPELATTTAAPKPLLDQAWEWAREATFPPLLERLNATLRGATPTLEIATGATLDAFAGQLFGLDRMSAAAPGFDGAQASETDEELRARCRAALDRLLPAGPSDAWPDYDLDDDLDDVRRVTVLAHRPADGAHRAGARTSTMPISPRPTHELLAGARHRAGNGSGSRARTGRGSAGGRR